MKKILYIVGVSCLIVLLIFLSFYYKKNNIGNNIGIKSENEVINYILDNFKTYEAEIEVTVYGNKTENKYKLKQICDYKKSYQEIEEPSDLKGIYVNLEDNKLTVRKHKIELKKDIREI